MEADRRLYFHGGGIRCREGHYVLPRSSGLLAVGAGGTLCDLFSRRRPRPARGTWGLEKSDRQDRGGLGLSLPVRAHRGARDRQHAILFDRERRDKQQNKQDSKRSGKRAA